MNIFISLLILTIFSIADITSKLFYSDLKKELLATSDFPPRGYGKYYLHLRYLESCEPDKAIDEKNENQYNFEVKIDNQQDHLFGYIYVPNDYHCVKAVFLPTIWKTNKSEPIFHKESNSPCTDLLVALPLKQLVDVDSNCIVKKGNYTLNGFVPDSWIHVIFKRQFIYERLQVVIAYYSKVGRTFCLNIIVDMRPLKKAKKH